MSNNGVHQCSCNECKKSGPNGTRELHAELNAFLSTLDEEKRLQFLGAIPLYCEPCPAAIRGLANWRPEELHQPKRSQPEKV